MRLRSRVALARTVLSFAAVSYFRTRAALDRVAPHATAPLCARLGAHAVAVATVALGAACGAELADEEVGLDVPHVTATVTCTPTDGATVRGDSPDGELWLAQGATTIVIAADGTRRALPWRIDDATALYPTSAGAAAAVIGGEVWTLDDGAREVVPTPTALGAAAAVCGPPSAEHGTFIATAGGLLERSAGLWWKWSAPTTAAGQGFDGARGLARVDGACAGPDDAVWLTTAAGALWRITRDRAELRPGPVDEVAIVPGVGAAVREADQLTLGPPWRGVRFAAGPVAHVASGGERLWVVAGGATLVRIADGWAIVDGLPAAPRRIWPDAAGGAWLEVGAEVCRASLAPAIRVDGLRPYEPRVAPLAQLRVAPPADATAITVERDGVALATAPVVDGVAALPDVELGAGGWHALTIRAGTATRVVPYNLLQISDRSWAADIEPIFAASCAGGRCHGPSPSGGRIDLSTYDGWRQKASRVRERLLRGEMPPSGPPLDSATIDVVIDWIEGGMRP